MFRDDLMHALPVELPGDLSGLARAVAEDLARERGPRAWLRSRSRGLRVALLAGLAAAEILVVVAFSPRPDLPDYPVARLALTFAWTAAIVVAAHVQALRPLHHAPARPWIVSAILFVAVAAPLALAFLPELPDAPGTAVPWFGTCLGKGVALALPLLLAGRALDRRGHAGRTSAALAAVAAGLAGVLGLGVHCPANDPLHLVCAHGTVPAVVLAVYLLISARRV